jgi:hypothetical protein
VRFSIRAHASFDVTVRLSASAKTGDQRIRQAPPLHDILGILGDEEIDRRLALASEMISKVVT